MIKYLESEYNAGNLRPDKQEVLSFLKKQLHRCFSYDVIRNYDFEVSADDVAIDIGSAEGNFTLNIIDKIQRAYVIEADPEWGRST